MKFPLLIGSALLATAAGAQTAPASGTPAPAVVPYRFTGIAPPVRRPAPATHEGTVLSAQTAGGYTYIEVAGPTGSVWLAAPETQLAVGDRIRYGGGAVMQNFTSKAIGRTFPTIVFVGSVSPAGAPGSAPAMAAAPVGAPPGHPPMQGAPAGHPPMQGAPAGGPGHGQMPMDAAPPPALSEGVVLSAQDAGGYSYIELKNAGGSVWLAAPATKLKTGDTVRYAGGSVMHNFSSRSLNRTFPEIVFVDRVAVVAGN